MGKNIAESIAEYSIKNQEELLNLFLSNLDLENQDLIRFDFYTNMINYCTQNLRNLYNKQKDNKMDVEKNTMDEEQVERIARRIIENPDSVGNFMFGLTEEELAAINNKIKDIRSSTKVM